MPTYVGYNGDFEVAPEGLHDAVCVDIDDLGEKPNPFDTSKTQHKVRIVWEINVDHPKFDGRFTVSGFYSKTLHPKGNLRKMLEQWRGKAMTDEEIKKFDLDVLIGKPCQVQVIHSDNGYANVSTVVQVGLDRLEPSGHYVRIQDRPSVEEQPASVGGDGSSVGSLRKVGDETVDDELAF